MNRATSSSHCSETAAGKTKFLGAAAIRRLCIDLIASEQDRLLREGRLSPGQHIHAWLSEHRADLESPLSIGAEVLGFDSLGLLDLVFTVSRFFSLGDSGAEDLLLVHRDLDDWVSIVLKHFEAVGQAVRIGFSTSGSTGLSKSICHQGNDLDAEVEEIRKSILNHLSPERRVLSFVPPRHIYGFLWTVLLPERSECSVVEFHRSVGDAMFREARPGDFVVGTPFTWDRVARIGGNLPPGVTGVTSGAPATPQTWEASAALGLDRLIEIYGSTETGGLGWRTDSRNPFELSMRFERSDAGLRRCASGDAVPLQDHLGWADVRHFHVEGRRDEVVQVAGTNVSPAHVAGILRSIDGVADAAVRLAGDRLKALIVPDRLDHDEAELEDALREKAARELAPPARPDRYAFASILPRTEIGKLADW